ncbi:GNAT family N-acetyltransferase [Streptomyces sp. NBC_01320]|uniref:GNAT family N-acetyltransferase n=1 Tax=Streptomyces sp. NBC_01320 TaxID=2903824 RepID=UPI002E103A57
MSSSGCAPQLSGGSPQRRIPLPAPLMDAYRRPPRLAPDRRPPMPVRPAIARDTDFLWRVLLEAYNWNGEQRFTVEQLAVDPYAARYLVGWPRRGDFGVVNETDAGEPVGAAWARCLPEDEPGCGFVAPDVPELTRGVLPGQRGRGHGQALMEALIRAAGERPASVDRLSLQRRGRATPPYASTHPSVLPGSGAMAVPTRCSWTSRPVPRTSRPVPPRKGLPGGSRSEP